MTAPSYVERNQRRLVAELGRVYAPLAERAGLPAADPPAVTPDATAPDATADGRIDQLVEIFRLSPFERDLLLWCAGVELDGRFGPAFATAYGDPHHTRPTFGLALATLADPHWDALAPDGRLRHWRLVELGPGPGLADRPLIADERIVHHLAGIGCLDPRLDGILEPAYAAGALTAGQQAVAAEVTALLDRLPAPAVVTLDGADPVTRRLFAQSVAEASGRLLLVLPAALLPGPGAEAAALARLVEREVALLGGLLLVEYADGDDARAVAALLGRIGCPALLGGAPALPGRPATARRTVPVPAVAEAHALWRGALNGRSEGYGPALAEVSAHFSFDAATVEALAAELAVADPGGRDPAVLWRTCRARAGSGLADLAERIEPGAGWGDIVLPEAATGALRDLVRQVRHRGRVHDEWGMADHSGRGLGVTALFTGESGTGKTLAAEVIAGELDLDLFRIDLAAVVSKYIGETEKNLRRVFDAAHASGAVLLFDEADALFGKRSEVRDSHDRYANLEIAYLLQRMETYRGLAILTTNLKSSVDRAFLRRIRFVVAFPFPDLAGRERIWRLNLPPKLPTDGVDLARLARLQVPGGNIRAIALGAAFLAAERGGPVTMADLLSAARREYAKLEKPLTDAETGGWS